MWNLNIYLLIVTNHQTYYDIITETHLLMCACLSSHGLRLVKVGVRSSQNGSIYQTSQLLAFEFTISNLTNLSMRCNHFHQFDRNFGLSTFLPCCAASIKAILCSLINRAMCQAFAAIERLFDIESIANFSYRLSCAQGNKICCFLESCFVATFIIQLCLLEFKFMSTCLLGKRWVRLMVDRDVVLTVVKLEEVVLLIVTSNIFLDSLPPVTSITISILSWIDFLIRTL